MSRKKNKTTKLFVLALMILLVPNLLVALFNYWDNKDFKEELTMNQAHCYERAEFYKFPGQVCDQIISNVKDAQRASKSNVNLGFLLLTGIIYGLSAGILGLREQVDELKEKIDV